MIKKYNININDYFWFDNIIYETECESTDFYKELQRQKKLNRLRIKNRISYSVEKFYLSNKNLWYNQKKQYINLNNNFKYTKVEKINFLNFYVINSKI